MPYWPTLSQLRCGFVTAAATVLLSGSTDSRSASSRCDRAAQQAAETSMVPLELLMAISRVETGRSSDGEIQPWPWTINQSGQGHWFDDADQAISFANDLLARGEENFDAGCFQINLHWHSKNFVSVDDMFDPVTNAAYAADFLTSLFQSQGGWPEAVAAYHSRSPDQAQAYLTKVEAALNALRAAGSVPPAPAPAPAPAPEDLMAATTTGTPRVNNFPLLQAGARGAAGSLVPLTEGAMPLFAAQP